MTEFLSIGAAALMLGVAISTLCRWEDEPQRMTIGYARVSSHDQAKDLQTQVARLEKHALDASYANFEVINDRGSGLNYLKRGLKRLIRLICQRRVKRLVIIHKDRLLRFGAELRFSLCHFYGTEVVILEAVEENFEQRLCHDVIELMTVFSARLYGSLSHRNQKTLTAA
jgi:putative resolvase